MITTDVFGEKSLEQLLASYVELHKDPSLILPMQIALKAIGDAKNVAGGDSAGRRLAEAPAGEAPAIAAGVAGGKAVSNRDEDID